MTLLWVMLPLPFINVLFARHAKSYFLAMDHLADPHVRPDQDEDDGGNEGGGPPLRPSPAPFDAPVRQDPAGPSGGGVPRERESAEAEPAGALEIAKAARVGGGRRTTHRHGRAIVRLRAQASPLLTR